MIISANSGSSLVQFNELLKKSITKLNHYAKSSTKEITLLTGNKLEPFIKEILVEEAIGTEFEDTIELVSGQKFPDIIANKFYGIEVKSTTQNHWKTTGNSVLESTRIEGIERIFMMFGKLSNPIEFRCRPYEECLSEVVVTHSPRYLIDMNLQKGATIFDEMKIEYDKLRKKDNPIKLIIQHYKKKLKQGEDIWWLDQEVNSKGSSLIIKIWNNLNTHEKNVLKIKAIIFFPELFSNSADKFNRISIWLLSIESVVCPNIRDIFTAGGRADLKIGNKTYYQVPKVIKTLFDNLPLIIKTINQISSIEINEHWNKQTSDKTKLKDWVSLVSSEAIKIKGMPNLELKELLYYCIFKRDVK